MPHDKKTKAIEGFRDGFTWEEVARSIGVDRKTIWRWSQADPEFKSAIEEAKAGPDDEVEAVTYANAIDPDPAHNTLRMFWLKSRRPAVYGTQVTVHQNIKAYEVGSSPDDIWPSEPTTPRVDMAPSAPPANSSTDTTTKSS